MFAFHRATKSDSIIFLSFDQIIFCHPETVDGRKTNRIDIKKVVKNLRLLI